MARRPTKATLRRQKVKRILARRNRYQFGQPRSGNRLVTSPGGTPGDVACSDTSIQLLYLICTGRKVSQDHVRRLSGNAPRSPMFALNALNAIRRLGLPYVIADISATEAMRITRDRGPVLIAEQYWAHPHWRGYPGTSGRARNNRGRLVQVGFAKPLGASGNNNVGFTLGHMVMLGWASYARQGGWRGGVRDPNHNSPSRPQKPAWDVVTPRQLRRMLDSIRPKWGGRRLCFIPTKVVVKV